jgi:tetratricopeptide (TPR) repeat protein
MLDKREITELVANYEANRELGDHICFDADVYRQLIEHYLLQESFDLALELTDQAISHYSYSADFLIRKAEILIQTDRENSALDILDYAESFAPGELDIILLRAEALSYLKLHDEAHDELNKAPLDLDDANQAEVYFVRALIFENSQNYEAMFESLRQAAKHDPNFKGGMEKLWSSVQHTRRYSESLSLHEQLIDENPYSSVAWYNLGMTHTCLGNFEEALEALEFAYLSDPQFEQAYRERAELAYALHRFALACEIYEEMTAHFSAEDTELQLRLGQCYLEMEQPEIARIHLRKCIALDQHQDEAYFALGQLFFQEKKWFDAQHFLMQAIKINAEREEYHAALAEAYIASNELELAEDHLNEATDLAPEESKYWLMLAQLLIETDRADEALDIFDLAEETATGAELVYGRIACLFELGQRQEALLELGFALEEEPDYYYSLFGFMPQLEKDAEVIALIRYHMKM